MTKFTLVTVDADSRVFTESLNSRQCVEVAFEHVDKVANFIHALDVLTENGYRVIVEYGDGTWIHGHTQGGALMEGPFDAVKAAVGSARDVLNRGANKNVNWDNIKKGVGQFYQGAKDKYKEATKEPDFTMTPDAVAQNVQNQQAFKQSQEAKGLEQVPYTRRANVNYGTAKGGTPSARTGGTYTQRGTEWKPKQAPVQEVPTVQGDVGTLSPEQMTQLKSGGNVNLGNTQSQRPAPQAPQAPNAQPALPPANKPANKPAPQLTATPQMRQAPVNELPTGDKPITMAGGTQTGSRIQGLMTQIDKLDPSLQQQVVQAIIAKYANK